MPIWLLSALALLAPIGIRAGGALARLGSGRALPAALGAGAGAAGALGISALTGGGVDVFGEEIKKRRRRRRALTASDRADIAFIAGILGRPAGKDFALIIATRAK